MVVDGPQCRGYVLHGSFERRLLGFEDQYRQVSPVHSTVRGGHHDMGWHNDWGEGTADNAKGQGSLDIIFLVRRMNNKQD